MRSLLVLAALTLVYFVDNNSAAAVRRDFGTPGVDSIVATSGSPTDAQTNVGTIAVAATSNTGVENNDSTTGEKYKENTPSTLAAAAAAATAPAPNAPAPNAPAPNAPAPAAPVPAAPVPGSPAPNAPSSNTSDSNTSDSNTSSPMAADSADAHGKN